MDGKILAFAKSVWESHKRDIIYIAVIVCAVVFCLSSIKQCSSNKASMKTLNHNIEALSDSVRYYTGKNGELIAEKKILIGDKETLELTNKELASKLASMKVKNAELAAQVKGLIENPARDTTWQFSTDTAYIALDFSRTFDFSDSYRALTGNVWAKGNQLGMQITEDKIFFDYTLAVKDGTIYMTSDNPYVQFNDVYGIVSEKPKPKRFNVGLQVGIGGQYGLVNKKVDVGPYVGIGLSYGFSF